MSQFTFDEATHCYRDNRGIVRPSVTRCMDQTGLADYSMVRADILERKSRLGTETHWATRLYDENDLDWNSLWEEVKPRVDAWAEFRAITGFTPFPNRIEFRHMACYNGMEYGMACDREGLLRGKLGVAEIKTSANEEDWHAIQLTGYVIGLPYERNSITGKAYDENGPLGREGSGGLAGFFAHERYVVRLMPNGKPKYVKYDDHNDWSTFDAALRLTNWRTNHRKPITEIE